MAPMTRCWPSGTSAREGSRPPRSTAGRTMDTVTETGTAVGLPAADDIRAIPLRHWGRWVAAIVIVLIAAWVTKAGIDSHFVKFAVVRKYVFNRTILEGLRNTIIISVCAQALGVALG